MLKYPPEHADSDPDAIEERAEKRQRRHMVVGVNRFGRAAHSYRLKHPGVGTGWRERAFAKIWFGRNRYWAGRLAGILDPATHTANPRGYVVTRKEANTAASLIQWLGTNVGFCFLEAALHEAGYVLVRKSK